MPHLGLFCFYYTKIKWTSNKLGKNNNNIFIPDKGRKIFKTYNQNETQYNTDLKF